MKKLMKKLEDIMVAITFAEAGEFDEANRIAGNETDPGRKDSNSCTCDRKIAGGSRNRSSFCNLPGRLALRAPEKGTRNFFDQLKTL